MSDMYTSVAPSIDGTHVTALHDFGDEGDGAAEPSAELPSGYVSDAELMAWLQAKSTGQYDDLREQMKISTGRQELIQELKNLQSDIERAVSPEDVDAIKAKIEVFLTDKKYAPYATELSTLLEGPRQALEHAEKSTGMDRLAEAAADGVILGALKDAITTETDKLGKIDSLALVQIQMLMSDAKETSQLASNVLSSRDQTSGSIIGNIRG